MIVNRYFRKLYVWYFDRKSNGKPYKPIEGVILNTKCEFKAHIEIRHSEFEYRYR